MTILLVHAACTLMMTGLIWFVQIVHYPLFASVGEAGFAAYEREHMRRTTLVVAPLMLVEAGSAVVLVVLSPSILTFAGVGLLVVIWASTALLQVPQHRALASGMDVDAMRRLVRTNWVRTAAWTGRSGIAAALLAV